VTSPRATLDAWRESGADRLDPVRFRLIDAMERRASRHEGAPRRLLDERLGTLIADYADAVARAAEHAPGAGDSSLAHEPLPAPLHADAQTTRRAPDTLRTLLDLLTASAAYPQLDSLDYFREVWAKVRTEKQLRQSLEQVPGNAGPLNSSSLVHRSLSLMSELSPGYLKQFLSYVDALSWLDQLNGGITPARDAPRKEPARKESAGAAAGSGKGASRGKAR
jgi:hypothetical protein